MANNKSIQFLRKTTTVLPVDVQSLLPGQPLVGFANKALYIGTPTSASDPTNGMIKIEDTRGFYSADRKPPYPTYYRHLIHIKFTGTPNTDVVFEYICGKKEAFSTYKEWKEYHGNVVSEEPYFIAAGVSDSKNVSTIYLQTASNAPPVDICLYSSTSPLSSSSSIMCGFNDSRFTFTDYRCSPINK